MAIPESYMAFRRAPGENAEVILPTIERIPSLKPTDVLIRVHAVSLNYRDVGMLHGKYPGLVKDQGVPASDCAGEVVDLGSAVTQLSLGDRVSPIFDLRYIEMPNPESKVAQLGGNVDGVLRQYAVFDESVLIRIPPHLSWEEVRGTSLLICLSPILPSNSWELIALLTYSEGRMHNMCRDYSLEFLGDERK